MDIDRVQYGAEISKINFLLENLYALVLRDAGASHEDIPHLRDEMLRQWGLPNTRYGGPANDTDETDAIRRIGAERIATFFLGIEKRLQSAGR